MSDKEPDFAHALKQMLEYCKGESGRSHLGYFGPGGWSYETCCELLEKLKQQEVAK